MQNCQRLPLKKEMENKSMLNLSILGIFTLKGVLKEKKEKDSVWGWGEHSIVQERKQNNRKNKTKLKTNKQTKKTHNQKNIQRQITLIKTETIFVLNLI